MSQRTDLAEHYERDIAELSGVLRTFFGTRLAIFVAAVETIAASIQAGGKILVFGNGGSAAEAQHFAAELVNGFLEWSKPALPAIALTADTSALTAIGNDRGFDQIFSRQIEAVGRPGDVAIGLTTSGRSPNIVRALKSARAGRLITIGLTGAGGGDIPPLVDYLLDVPSCSTPRIQEALLFLLHVLAEELEKRSPEAPSNAS
jgi:D-sedoheptulose 7-phosphate isomerase